MSSEATPCPRCGAPLRAGSRLCARCALAAALRPGPAEVETAAFPRRFAGYELQGELGRGGMGVVFRAVAAAPARTVALKVIRSGALATEEELRRFRAEIQAATTAEHPHILPVYAAGEHDGQPFYTMRLVEGPSLSQHLSTRGAMPAREAAAMLADICRGVDHAHRRGVLHRDLKPANILLDPAAGPQITDFGLARLADAAGLTQTLETAGTPAYMSPETASGGSHAATTGSDVFSLGAILYHCLSGRSAFPAATPLETLRAVAENDPVSLAPLGIPRDLECITLRALEKDAARRYATAGDFADDLDRWLRHEPVLARPAGAWRRAGKWLRRHPAAAALLASAFIAASLLAVREWQNSRALRSERDAARAAAQRADAAAAAAREEANAARIALAFRALEQGNYGAVRAALDASEAARRGYEWHWLHARIAGEQRTVLHGHTGALTALAFSPDGTQLASAAFGDRLRTWRTADGVALTSFPAAAPGDKLAANKALITAGLTSPHILPLYQEDPIGAGERIWEGARPHSQQTVYALAWKPDGAELLAGSNTWVRQWRVADGALTGYLPADDCAAFLNPDASTLYAVPHRSGELTAWPLAGGAVKKLGAATGAALSRDGTRLVAGAASDLWRVLDAATGAEICRFPADGDAPRALAFSPDGKEVRGFCAFQGSLYRWDAATGALLGKADAIALAASAAAWAPDGTTVALAMRDQSLQLFDAVSFTLQRTLRGHLNAVTAVTWSPDGRTLASGSTDHTVRLWSREPSAAREPRRISCDGKHGTLTADARYYITTGGQRCELATGALTADTPPQRCTLSEDGTVLLQRAGAPEPVAIPGIKEMPPGTKAVFSPDGLTLLITAWPDRLYCVDTAGAALRWRLTGEDIHPAHAAGIAFTPDGTRAALALPRGDLALLDLRDGTRLATFSGHADSVTACAISADGLTLASASTDETVRLWSLTVLRELGTIQPRLDADALAFSPDGTLIAIKATRDTIEIWPDRR